MPKLTGTFSYFKNLDKISPESINKWLRIKKDNQYLINYLGNRIIYPQTIAISPEEMEIDLSILRQALSLDSSGFYQSEKKEIEVPQEFLTRFFPEFRLIAAIIDGVEALGLNKIVVKLKEARKVLAVTFKPNILSQRDLINATIGGKTFQLLPNTLTLIPCKGEKMKLKLDGLEEIEFDPGDIGIFVDLRNKPK